MALPLHVVFREEPMVREAYRYAKALLLERRQELGDLEVKYRGVVPPPSDYLSCRRSLLQAINQLETLLGTDCDAALAGDWRKLKE